MSQWYCRVSGIREGAVKEFGPISSTTLRQWVSEQRMSPTDMVKEEGGQWFAASKLQGVTWPTTSEPSVSPPPPPPDPCNMDSVEVELVGKRRKNRPSNTNNTTVIRIHDLITSGVVGAICVGAASVVVGALVSQYAPLLGGLLVQIAEPFSPVRLQILPAHCVLFGLVGAVLGFAFALAVIALSKNHRRR